MNRGHLRLFLSLLAGMLLLAAVFSSASEPPRRQSAQEQQKKQDPTYTEVEYDACMNAINEPDLDKRQEMILAFMEKYPKVMQLRPHAVAAYQTLMFEYYKTGAFDKLEPAAEKWLKYFPEDLKTIVYIAESAQKLGHDEKFIEYGEKIFAQKSEPQLGLAIYQAYQRLGNKPKQEEWALKLMEYPEFNDNFELRLPFVIKHAETDLVKAAEYAEMTLKALDLAKRPESTPAAKWNEVVANVRIDCNNIIAMNHYNRDRYAQAVQKFQSILKVRQSDMAYYYIGMCWWKMGDVSDNTTVLAFLKAELLNGEYSAKAKENAENLYKNNHGGNLTGIEKLKRRAKAELDTASAKK